jgi:hypothetical protein
MSIYSNYCPLMRYNCQKMKVDEILSPFGGISQTDDLILFGVHSTNRMSSCSVRSTFVRQSF